MVNKVYQKLSTVLFLFVLLAMPITASAKNQLRMLSRATVEESKAYNSSKTAKVISHGEIDRSQLIAGHTRIKVTASAHYEDAEPGDNKIIIIEYTVAPYPNDLSNTDDTYYIAPKNDTVRGCQIVRATLTLSYPDAQQYIQKNKVYDGTDEAFFIEGKTPVLSGTYGTHTQVSLSRIEARYDDKYYRGDAAMTSISVTCFITGPDTIYYNAPVVEPIEECHIYQRPLTISGVVVSGSKVYDGTDVATIEDWGTLYGVVPGDNVYISRELTTATYDSKDAKNGRRVTVHYVLAGGNEVSQYIAPSDDEEQYSNITKRSVSVIEGSTTVNTKQYDGNTVAVVGKNGTLDNVVEGDDVMLNVSSAVYSSPDAGTHDVAVAFYLTGDDAGNYNLLPSSGTTGVIEPLTLGIENVSIVNSKVYDGNKSAAFTQNGEGNLVGVVADDVVTFTATASYYDENASSDTAKRVTVTFTIYEQDGKHNYNAPSPLTKYAYITPKQLYISGFEIDTTKVYDRTTNVIVRNNGSLDGVVSGDESFVGVSHTVNYYDFNTGIDKPVHANFVLTGSKKNNYKAPEMPTDLIADITPRQLTAPDPDVQKIKSYDGNATAKVTVAQRPDGVVAPDQIDLRGIASYDNKEVGDNKTITVKYELTGDPTVIKNYIAPVDYLTIGKITKSTNDTVKAGSISYQKEKTYDGTTDIIMIDSIGELSKKNSKDSVWVVARARYADPDAETGKTIIIEYRLEGRDMNNYEVPETEYITGEGVIRPKQLSILSAPKAKDKVFDGTTVAELDGTVTLNGVIGTDYVDVSAAARFDTAIVGNRQVVFTFSLTGDAKDNYIAPVWPGKVNAKITKRQLHASAPALTTRKMYDGNTNAEVSVSADMFTNLCAGYEDVILEVISSKYDDATVGTNKRITVTYRINGNHAGNYSAPTDYSITYGEIYVNDVLTVEPGSVNFQNKKTYDGTDTIHVNNPGSLIGGYGDVTLVTTARYGDVNVGDGKMVIIEYSLEGPGKDYYATPEPETLYTGVITAKKLEIVQAPEAEDKVFDGGTDAQLIGNAIFTGVVSRGGVLDDVDISATGVFEKRTVDLTKKRKVTISYSLAGDDAFNYSTPNSSTDSAFITPLQLVANAPDITLSKSYDGNKIAIVAPGTLQNVVEGFTDFTFTASGQYDNPDVGTAKSITVIYSIDGTDAVNYIKPNNYTVNNGVITASDDVVVDFESVVFDTAKVYDGTDTIHIIYSGNLIGIDDEDDVTLITRAHYDNANVGEGKTIVIEYELVGPDKDNYSTPKSVTTKNGVITPRTLGLQQNLTPSDKDFNGADDVALSGSVTLTDVLACDNGKISVSAVGKFADVTAGHGKDVRITFELSGNPVTVNNYVTPAEIRDTATIRPKKLKASAPLITKTKVYDGNANAAVSVGSLTNMVNGFENVALGATALYDNENEGSSKLITVSYTISGNDAINYIAPDDYIVRDGKITKAKTISVDISTVIFNPEKTYDGTDSIDVPEGGDGQISGLADPDDDVTLKTTVYYEDKNAGDGKMIIIHYELIGDDSGNYEAPKNDTLYNAGVIYPKQILLIQEPTASDRYFDGTNVAPLSTNEPQVDGIESGDDATVHAEGHFYDAIADTTGKQVKVTYYITGVDKDNYIAPDATYSTANIRPLKLMAGVPDVVKRKEYDRTNAAAVSVSSDLLTNLVEPYTNIDLHAVATYNNEKVATGKHIVVAYSITGEDAVNYIAPDNYEKIYDGEIYKNSSARVEGTEVNTSKEYDGTTAVEVIADGTINNDPSVTVIAHPKYETPEAGYGKMIVITYELEGTGKGYYETPEPDTIYDAVITPKAVYVVGSVANDKYYDGTYDATVDLSNSMLNAKVGNDTVVISADALFSKKNVGHHPVVVTYTLSGPQSTNYYLGDSANVILHASILKKPVSVVGVVANDVRPFNDSTDVEVVYGGHIMGLVEGDNVGVVATAMFDDKNVGIRNVFYHFDFIGDTANYMITNIDSVDNAGGEITPVKPYVVGTVIDTTKVYDGTRNAWVRNAGTLYGFSMDGVFLSASATYSDENVANAIPVYVTYSITGPNAYNFETPDVATLQANITPKKLSVAGINVSPSKGYDKLDTISIIYPGDLVGVCTPDSNKVGFNVRAHYDDVNVGVAKSVSVHYSLTGSKSGNYTVADTFLTADITRRQLYVAGTVVDTTKQYDGSDYANVQTSGQLVGVAADDEVFVDAVAAYGSVTAGDSKIINVVYSIIGDDATNYIKPQDSVITVNGSIKKRQLYISDMTLDTTKVYDGNTIANVSVNGVVPVFNGDNVSVTAYANYADKNVGNGIITVHYILSGDTVNYIVPDSLLANGSITCKPVTVVGARVDSTKVYDGTSNINIIDNGTSSDFIAGDNVMVATNALLVGETYGVVSEVAVSYYLVGNDNGNYCLTTENDTLQMNVIINPKLIDTAFVSSVINPVKVYDATTDANAIVQLNPACIVGEDDIQLNVIAYYDSKNVGARMITVIYTLSGDDYYKYQAPSGFVCQGTIVPAPLTISDPVVDEWKMYDGNSVANVLGKAVPTNVYAGDQLFVLTNAVYNDSLPATGKTIKVYFSTYGNDAANYTIPDSMLYSTAGIIFDTISLKEQANGMKFITDAVSYCKDDKVTIGYNVLTGDPVEYRLEFLGAAKSLFTDSAWTPLSDDNTISFPIDPRDDVHGVYQGVVTMRNAVQQRDNDMKGLCSDTFEIRVNMSADAYLTKMFSDVISLVLTHDGDTFTTYQWYKNGDLIPGATLPYYKEEGGLDGVFYCIVNMGTPSEERTCDSPLYERGKNNDKRIRAYPNPVQDHVTLKIDNFENDEHMLKVVDAMGNTLDTEEFEGDVVDFNMDGYVPGVYTMTIDEMQIKVIKK